MIGKYLVNEQYILETSHWLITSPYEHEMTVNFINPASAVVVNQNGILVQPLRSNQMQSWFGCWGLERVNKSFEHKLLQLFLFGIFIPLQGMCAVKQHVGLIIAFVFNLGLDIYAAIIFSAISILH